MIKMLPLLINPQYINQKMTNEAWLCVEVDEEAVIEEDTENSNAV